MRSVWQDVKYSARAFARTPGFTAVVLLTLALGIGANTAIFTLIKGVLLVTLPVRDPDALVLVGNGNNCCINSGNQRSFELFAYPLYRMVRDQKELFSELAAFDAQDDVVSLRVSGEQGAAEQAHGKLVSANYFSVMGALPVMGRGFLPEEEDRPSAVAVISYDYWRTRFRGDPNIVGHGIIVNSNPVTIVGVAPPKFFGETLRAMATQIWFPVSMQSAILARPSLLQSGGTYWLYVMGRLAPGANRDAVAGRLTQIAQNWEREGSGQKPSKQELENISKTTVTLHSGAGGVPNLNQRYEDPLRILMAIVGLVLVIACCNIANLFLARATSREKEVATRVALGASNLRLVRQLLTESILISLIGGCAGLLIAFWGSKGLLKLAFRNAQNMPISSAPSLEVLLFALGLSLLVGIAFGLAPAWRSANIDVFEKLHPGGSRGGFRGPSLGKFLVTAQIAFCMLLMVGASLFVVSFLHLQQVQMGFDESVIDAHIDPEFANYTPERAKTLYARIREELARVPGVSKVALAFYTPFSGTLWQSTFNIPGYLSGPRPEEGVAAWTRVSPAYFDTIGIRVNSGREIGEQDTQERPRVAVINEAMKRKYFSGQDPIGRRIRFGDSPPQDDFEIVGVVADVKVIRVREEANPAVYLPLDQKSPYEAKEQFLAPSFSAREVVVQASGDPAVMSDRIRKTLQQIDPALPVSNVATFREKVGRSLAREQMMTILSVSFGVLALLLACVGLYGLMSYSLARRTKEFGIRIALGADTQQIVSLVLREVLALIIAGLVIGIPLVLGGTRFAASQLYGIGARDPWTIVAAAAALSMIAIFAGFVPARRATRVDPMISLRAE